VCEKVRHLLAMSRVLMRDLVVQSVPAPTSDELRAAIKLSLPEYMVPGACVCDCVCVVTQHACAHTQDAIEAIDVLPLTLSGKTDRKKLPVIKMAEAVRQTEVVAASSKLESLVVTAFATTLNVPPNTISVDDDFFMALGGNSFLAAQV
jgi:hypothetical protein